MPYAVLLYFDDAISKKLGKVWDELDRRGAASFMKRQDIRPHITLGVCDNIANVDSFRKNLKAFTESFSPFEVDLAFIGLFDGSPIAVFYGVTVTERLLWVHGEFHDIIYKNAEGTFQVFHPGRWVPHVTAALDLQSEQVPRAIEICRNLQLPQKGMIESLAVVDLPEGSELFRQKLGGDSNSDNAEQ